MEKIAAALQQALDLRRTCGAPGGMQPRVIARGDGWSVADVVCTAGPDDHPFEEVHARTTIAIVAAGSFQYRSPGGHALMTPGSLMLGNEGHGFECAHEHGEGDRCVSFWFAPELFERLAADAGSRLSLGLFATGRVPPVRALAPLVARATNGVLVPGALSWEELSVALATRLVRMAGTAARSSTAPRDAEARVTRIVRGIDDAVEDAFDTSLTLASLASRAGLSPYHFLRTFTRVTGVTPRQYILRARLRRAARQLLADPARVLDVALESGFGDLSNFNRAFRAEFGVTPRGYRRTGHERT